MTTTLRLMDSATAAFASQFKLHSVLSLSHSHSLSPLPVLSVSQSYVRFTSVRFVSLGSLCLRSLGTLLSLADPSQLLLCVHACVCVRVFVLGLRYKSIIIKSFCCFISSATMLRSSGSSGAQVPWQHVALLINIASVFN